VLTREQLREVVDLLCSLPLDKRREVPGINPERADIIIAGAAILESLMDQLRIPEIVVSERGLREGLPSTTCRGRQCASLRADIIPRAERARTRPALRLRRAARAAVVRIAWSSSIRRAEAGLHNFGEWERELLEHAASCTTWGPSCRTPTTARIRTMSSATPTCWVSTRPKSR